MIQLKILPAGHGDALLLKWVEAGVSYHVLIDGGIPKTFTQSILPEIENIRNNGCFLDLVVLTHIDYDHISGILELAKAIQAEQIPASFIRSWWFNSGLMIDHARHQTVVDLQKSIPLGGGKQPGQHQVSVRQGMSLERFLQGTPHWHSEPITHSHQTEILGGASFHFLSPDFANLHELAEKWTEALQQEKNRQVSAKKRDYALDVHHLNTLHFKADRSLFNASSIAFIWSFQDKNILFLGDATPTVYLESIKKFMAEKGLAKLKLAAMKLAHHGSKHNFDPELLELIDCEYFLLSTDGSHSGLPDKSVLAKIILQPNRDKNRPIHFCFNYNNTILQSIFRSDPPQLGTTYNFSLKFPQANQNGYCLEI